MNATVRVRVLCGVCDRMICQIVDGTDGVMFYRLSTGKGGDNLEPRTVFCSEHGWPDLAGADLASELARARSSGRPRVYRARMGLRPS